MSNVKDTDTFIVSREGTEFKVKSENTSNLRDTDLFWVQRSGVNYSVTADQVNAGSKAEEPELGEGGWETFREQRPSDSSALRAFAFCNARAFHRNSPWSVRWDNPAASERG